MMARCETEEAVVNVRRAYFSYQPNYAADCVGRPFTLTAIMSRPFLRSLSCNLFKLGTGESLCSKTISVRDPCRLQGALSLYLLTASCVFSTNMCTIPSSRSTMHSRAMCCRDSPPGDTRIWMGDPWSSFRASWNCSAAFFRGFLGVHHAQVVQRRQCGAGGVKVSLAVSESFSVNAPI